MPLPFIARAYFYGWPPWMPDPWVLARYGGSLAALAATKYLCSGATNKAERSMHGRVVMITGGTSGIGAVVAYELAKRGAHTVLLTSRPPSDPFVADYVDELRERVGHPMVYAEQADLTSLHSIRTFATKWIDSLPPRRLDMVVLCAAVDAVPMPAAPGTPARGTTTAEGLERAWMANYLANFHLLGLLSPALRSQPFDRDVRVIIATCSSYIGAPPLVAMTDKDKAEKPEAEKPEAKKGKDKGKEKSTDNTDKPTSPNNSQISDWTPRRAYARSKLALMIFARAYQKHVDSYKRPDGLPSNVRVLLVDPGAARTPGFRRWVSGGSLLGLLLIYVLLYPLWWLFVPAAEDGAQSVLYAAMEADLRRMRDLGRAGEALDAGMADDAVSHKLVKRCRLVDVARRDVDDEAVAKALWQESDLLVEETEKRALQMRQEAQKQAEADEKKAKEDEQASEIAALVDTIKAGQKREKAKTKAASGKGKTEKTKAEKTEKTEKIEKTENVEKIEKTDKADKAEKTEKIEKKRGPRRKA